ncbi:hypothetical protein SAMN04488105_101136 [Salipiger thiooxidans]|uniref:SGNH domain-containing protein n=1 Tax=Salipiger thiooxidans TaxID=282683 RepID=A0A1G7AGS1_9RHOB|nr:hypothetical protein [Salipiger thiooxidans]SDE13930.1 hypothetical protein SAMN04488105_101136 [Salipiger thiooxidans]
MRPLSLGGIALIVGAIFVFDERTPFPSLYALAPTLAAAAIILFAPQGTLVAKLLSMRASVGAGLASCSAYLWPQPLFAFARLRSMENCIAFNTKVLDDLRHQDSVKYVVLSSPFRAYVSKDRQVLAPDGICRAMADGHFVYFDHGHLTREGSRDPGRRMGWGTMIQSTPVN